MSEEGTAMKTGRGLGLIILGLWLAFSSDSLAQSSGPDEDRPIRPNILVLMAEDMSDRVGAFGDPVAVTPNLDALAAEGVRYTETFTAAGVCAPSRAAFLTGMHPISIGAQHMRSSSHPEGEYRAVPPPEVKAFPELLRAAGYYTFTDGKLDYQFSGPLSGTGPETIWDMELGNEYWAGRASPSQPFFGLINFEETHESGVFTQLFEGWPHSAIHFVMQGVRTLVLGIPSGGGTVQPEDVILPPYFPDTPTVRSDLARHYKNIELMDGRVGRILERLEADGLSDSTIVVWTTDHGDGLPRSKRDLYDSGIEVPMVIRWPELFRPAGVEPGTIDARLISFVDLAPTLLELAGVEAPSYFQGRSFAGTDKEIRDYVFASRDRIDEVEDRERAVRDHRYKYIRSWEPALPNGHPSAFRDNMEMMRELWVLKEAGQLDAVQEIWFLPTGEERLYDTKTDPFELRNLAGDPAHGKTLKRMRGAYAEWRDRVPDWSDQPESEMAESMWPAGRQPVTQEPRFNPKEGRVEISSPTEGASIQYRIDGGPWTMYTAPVRVPEGSELQAQAVRYGYESRESRLSRELSR
ncbi:MAG: sulfatase [Spirochaeta sp.]|nr:sulfatase [Spirochaeta sp.]RPG06199.1 MAG: sulfatase [Proteobacteria bacterium TMED72]